MAASNARKLRDAKKEDAAGLGHNGIDPEKRAKAILAAAKKQKALDERRESAVAGFRIDHKAISADLKKHGVSRGAFDDEFKLWRKGEDAKGVNEKKLADAEEITYRNERAIVYEALHGVQLDLFKVREKAADAEKAIAAAKASVEEPEEEEL